MNKGLQEILDMIDKADKLSNAERSLCRSIANKAHQIGFDEGMETATRIQEQVRAALNV